MKYFFNLLLTGTVAAARGAAPKIALMAGLCVLAFPMKASSQIIADFTAGNTTTQVDGYPGMAGSGWLGPWTPSAWGSYITSSGTVLSTTPLITGGGNYLSASLTVNTGAPLNNYFANMGRKFDTTVVSSTAAYTVSFLYRLDTAMPDENDAVILYGDTASGYEYFDEDSTNTWYINGYDNGGSPYWQVQDGDTLGDVDNMIDTGMALNVGTIYSFVINVDPVNQSYTVAIFDGVTQYQSPVLGLRGSAFDGGNSLYFGGIASNSTLALDFSLDDVAVAVGVGGPNEDVINLTDIPWTDPGPGTANDMVILDPNDFTDPPALPVADDTTIQDGGP